MSDYCSNFNKGLLNDIHDNYHNYTYGFPENNDNKLFEKLVLEINQAGLSWEIILKKYKGLYKAYSGLNIIKVANYRNSDIKELLENKGIIRNKLKIFSIIYNAKVILEIQSNHKSFKLWLDKHSFLNIEDWIKLFKTKFKFTGYNITKEFLLSSGYIEGAHKKNCKVYKEILRKSPKWYKK